MQETHTLEKKDWAAKLMAIAVVVFMVSSTVVLFAPDASAREGTGSFGYTFKDNLESGGPAFSTDWVELVGHPDSTTLISYSTDGAQGPMDLPFEFEWYEQTMTQWGNGGDNGYITLGSATIGNQWTPYQIPANQLGKNAIAGGWFDGGFCRASNSDAGVYYATIGTSPNRKFIVQYEDQGAWYPSVYQCPGTAAGDALTWQIQLHEGTNAVETLYEDVQGGYGSDNEYMTVGIQGTPESALEGLQYSYRQNPDVPAETAVLFSAPQPPTNDLRLTGSTIPDPVSLAAQNVFGAEVTNKGVNCDRSSDPECAAPETEIDVSASVFSIQESVTTYDFDEGDDGGFTSGSYQGMDKWTTNLNDGVGNYNHGDDGTNDGTDGAFSSGRKSTAAGGMFSDSNIIHYDGTNILIANKGKHEVQELDTSTNPETVSTIIGPDTTNLMNVLDVSSDASYYYTLARSSNLYGPATVVCKWDKSSTSTPVACNTSSVSYGVALTYYDGEIFALQGGHTSTTYRKAIILDATSSTLAATGKSIDYYSGVSAYSYASNIDVDETTGDMYIVYRDFQGRVRNYERQSTDDYCASSACYTQVYTYARYSNSIDVQDDYVYTNGYYYSSYYGGLKKCATSSSSISCSGMWSYFGDSGYKGAVAVQADGDVYINSNYAYRYYNYFNNDDKLFVYESGDTDGTATRILGPSPAMKSHLTSPTYDTSSAVGMTMDFMISYQFYYRYEGAYMEASVDNGATWTYVPSSAFTSGGYYGTVFGNYNNPLDLALDYWTYYNVYNQYCYNCHTSPWQKQSVNLDSYTGYSQVSFRWVVGYNQYLQSYYNSYFRLDDVSVTVKEAGTTFVSETKTIASLDFKASESVEFFTGCSDTAYSSEIDCEAAGKAWGFRPADSIHGLAVGDKVGVLISVENNNGNDEDMSNNRDVAFREIKYVVFADNFEDGDMSTSSGDWTTDKVKYGRGDWDVMDRDAFGGSYSMDSDYRSTGAVPGDPYVSTPALDLTLPVEAEIQMMISYYCYYLYDGYQMQISEDDGATWGIITPTSTAGDGGGYPYVIYNYAYYGNPLRGQRGYTYYGTTTTTYSFSPDPQSWVKVTFDLTPYVGQDDIKFRVVAGWTSAPNYAYWQSFLRFDDFAVTGLVYNNNVGLTALDLPDPLGIDETVEVGTNVYNAGINAQANGDTKLQLSVGPLGIETLSTSDDLESYGSQAEATSPTNGNWSTSTTCSDVAGNSCHQWGTNPGFVFNTDADKGREDGDTDTNAWGSSGTEFQIFYGGGSTEVTTGSLDFTGSPADMIMSLKHRYNYDIYKGYPSYNGGNVKYHLVGDTDYIDADGNEIWNILTPNGGYPGTISSSLSWGNPLGGQAGFVNCGSCPNSGAAMDDEDEYITTEFDMGDFIGEKVRFKFEAGIYKYKWPSEGEHWHIDSLMFTGTGMESVSFSEMVTVSGAGANFAQGESVYKKWDYYFQVPGEYRIQLDTWIGVCNPSSFGYACDVPFGAGDDFSGDNQVALARETMFMVAGTTADETALGKGNDEFGQRFYDNDWMSLKNDNIKDGFQWRPSTGGTSHDPVWWVGPDSTLASGSTYNGDDVSLTSPVFDLSKASSAKLVFQHRYMFYGSESQYSSYYYEGGRVEISEDGGTTWAALAVSSGESYGGTIYSYAGYGNPLAGQTAFVMASSGGTGFVETQCRLDAYTGAGYDNLKVRFHFGGGYPAWSSSWEIDDVGIYALGFDLKQTSASTPYTLEVGETATISTSFSNPGLGNLGPGGAVEEAFAYAYVNDISGNELWSESKDIGDLDMAYYDSTGATHAGEATDEITFTYPGMDTAGMYTIGVKVADSTGATLADLFSANNDASHMLAVGLHAGMGDPVLNFNEFPSGWTEVSDAPPEVGDGAMGVTWDETGVGAGTFSVSIAGMSGYDPEAPSVQIGTTVTWTNNDPTYTHTVTDRDGGFDSFDITPGTSWQQTFATVGVYDYYCKHHPGMEGSITVVSDASADEQTRTNYLKVWSADSYLVFWADFEMSTDSFINVYAQPKGHTLDGENTDTLMLTGANGFEIVDGSDHSSIGDSLTGKSSGWNPYYIHLDSQKLGYNSLEYDPSDDNPYSFVFRARGTSGTADIGGVQLIRTLDTGFFMTKDDHSKLEYEIFPSLAVEIDYFAKNTGTVDNTLRLNPGLIALGKEYDGEAFEITIEVKMNGADFDGVTKTQKTDGTWSHEFDMEPDDEAMVTIRFAAPEYNTETGEPAGNRKFDVTLNAYDTGSGESIREPVAATLFIKPSQFVLGEISFNRESVLEGDTLDITVTASNEGNYASDVLVVFYVRDSSGDSYQTLGGQGGNQRMVRVASTTIDLMEPVPVLESQGKYKTWYEATATWDETYIPGTTLQDYDTVKIYAEINPLPEQQDLDAGLKLQDEYDDQKSDNDANGEIHVVKTKASTPSFAVGIIGMSVAALVVAIGASLRREEEE
ncbi:MAG: plastocyanin/azurin family copper-binding protein [Candidatus Thermoplasmatota archaeon]|nr:plastocyanin/azurin family copper-binding protein [Candidatus Thermoplasmatota archaeon]